jgi:hypothetical protein
MPGPAGVGAGRRCVVGATARGGAPRAEKAATACGGWRARRRPGSGACGFFFLFYLFLIIILDDETFFLSNLPLLNRVNLT